MSSHVLKKFSFEKDSLVLIAMPSFGGVAPGLALERLSMLKGNNAMCVVTAVYGNRAYEDTLLQMQDYAQTSGFQVIAAISAVAEHSIIRKYATGRPNLNDYKELSEFGNRILEKAASGALSTPVVPGNRPYKKAGTGMIPKADATCTSCGLCARKCPSGAIRRTEAFRQKQMYLLYEMCVHMPGSCKKGQPAYDFNRCRCTQKSLLY